MYVAMNRFRVAPDAGGTFEAAWRDRQSYLDQVPGFVSFQLLRGADGVFVSQSLWRDEASFVAWTESEAFRKAHGQRLPEGTLMGPPELSCYDVVLSEACE
jgi:heme-degrading monooxygenase HmoA